MTRIDLITSPGCPGSPAARRAVAEFARTHRGAVLVREWDVTRDPGPARGRGIVATPAVLVDGRRILVGVPDAQALAGAAAR